MDRYLRSRSASLKFEKNAHALMTGYTGWKLFEQMLLHSGHDVARRDMSSSPSLPAHKIGRRWKFQWSEANVMVKNKRSDSIELLQ